MSESYRDKLKAALGYGEEQAPAPPETAKQGISTLAEKLKEAGNAASKAAEVIAESVKKAKAAASATTFSASTSELMMWAEREARRSLYGEWGLQEPNSLSLRNLNWKWDEQSSNPFAIKWEIKEDE